MLLKYNVLFYYSISSEPVYVCCNGYEKKGNDCIRKF